MAAKQAGKTDNQRKAFDFLKDHFESQAPFTKKDSEAVTTWKGKSFSTYWLKQSLAFRWQHRRQEFPSNRRVSPLCDVGRIPKTCHASSSCLLGLYALPL